MDYSPGSVSGAAAAALLCAAFTLAAHGGQGSTIGSAERASRERMAREAADSEEREMMLMLTERYHRSGEQRDPRLAFAQIREDFIRLQVVNNDLAKAVAGGGRLDLKLVAKSASEIRRRAERLKDNLALPVDEGDGKSPAATLPADAEQLKAALLRLDGMVLRFANELHTKGVRRFDARSSGKMRRDLEEIIALSGRAKKGCEKLEKTAPR